MNALYQHCQEWEFGNCPFAVTAETLKKKRKQLSSRDYYQSLNSLCRRCHVPLWIIERSCPSCGNSDLINIYSCSADRRYPRVYRLVCPECGRWLFTGSYNCLGLSPIP